MGVFPVGKGKKWIDICRKSLLWQIKILLQIGKNIKEARNEKQMKGETFANAYGVKKAAVSHMENGKMDFKISDLYRISDILETDVCSLLPLNIITSTKELEDLPANQEAILVHRSVVDQLISQMQEMKRKMK